MHMLRRFHDLLHRKINGNQEVARERNGTRKIEPPSALTSSSLSCLYERLQDNLL
jgi:hypothetical protein